MSCCFTKMFVYLSVIATACYFSVYTLIGCDPKQSKATAETLEKGVKHAQKSVESRSGVFIDNFEHISHFFRVSIVDFE